MVAVLRRKQVCNRAGLSESHIDNLVRDNKFPLPIQLGERAVGWFEHEVDEWIANRPRVSWAPQVDPGSTKPQAGKA